MAMVALLITFNAAVFGVNTVIFLTALSTIDRSTVEAARLDGASEFRILIAIILPAVRRFVEFVFIITMVASFTGIFGLIYVMTGGGPGSSTMTLEFAVWRRALSTGAFGPGAAIGVSLMLLILVVIGAVRAISRTGEAR
jgi:multiple sugar transport system permease protein